ncbi:hypothetical protein FA95DRAFT_1606988 [Auriscalpium vulgare]|uniref:Uncharacterized protein n=1 Tax=Auriscalpium vulgare TaxID=40419 RepID=A0ACB8RQR8_9AGAM|nr:hypothetical protein FA95DRAFT_1606988 [Auriscalpium vulgare]
MNALLEASLEIEEGSKIMSKFRDTRQSTTPARNTEKSVERTRKSTTTSSAPARRARPSRGQAQPARTGQTPTQTRTGSGPERPRPDTGHPQKLPGRPSGQPRAAVGKDGKPITCFGCGQTGHYSSDPTCPQFGKPRMFATRVVNDNSEDEQAGEPETQSNESSPGDSDDERADNDEEAPKEHWTSSDDYIEDMEYLDPPSDDDEGPPLRLASMRMFSMRITPASDEEDNVSLGSEFDDMPGLIELGPAPTQQAVDLGRLLGEDAVQYLQRRIPMGLPGPTYPGPGPSRPAPGPSHLTRVAPPGPYSPPDSPGTGIENMLRAALSLGRTPSPTP